MQRLKKVLLIILVIGTSLLATYSHIVAAQVSITSDYIPKGVKPGDKPITLNKDLLAKLFPELQNPRLMSYEDIIDPDDRESFIEGGYAFVLRSDYNRDSFADIVLVGKYNSENSQKNCFIGILTIKGTKVVREYFKKLDTSKVFLINVMNYKPRINAIGVIYSFFSEACGYLYWTGTDWKFDPCQAVF